MENWIDENWQNRRKNLNKNRVESEKEFNELICVIFNQILLATFVLAVSARPQEYDDYDQPAARPASRNQQQQAAQPQQQKKAKSDDRETTTWIPIVQYDKQQGTDGSYKTRWAFKHVK